MTTRRTSPKSKGSNPYFAFKSDRDRLWALVSRDARLVLIAFAGVTNIPTLFSYAAKAWTVLTSM